MSAPPRIVAVIAALIFYSSCGGESGSVPNPVNTLDGILGDRASGVLGPSPGISQTALTASSNTTWSKRISDPLYIDGYSIVVDSSGNTLVAGDFSGTVDFGTAQITSQGSYTSYLTMFDPVGIPLWTRVFQATSSTGVSRSHAIALDSQGNILLTGSFSGSVDFGGGPIASQGPLDIFVAKLNHSGTLQWVKDFGGNSNCVGNGIAVGTGNSMYVVGAFQGTLKWKGGSLKSGGDYDAVVLSLDASGNVLSAIAYGDAARQSAYAVAVDSQGNYVVGGSLFGSANFGTGKLVSAGDEDVFVAKFNSKGKAIWAKRFGDVATQTLYGLAVDAPGNVSFAGRFQGTINFGSGSLTSAGDFDAFVASLDPNGNPRWAKGWGDAAMQTAYGLTADASGNLTVTGTFMGSMNFGINDGPLISAGDRDIFLAKLSGAQGIPLASQAFGDSSGQAGFAVATNSAGNTLLTGYVGGTVSFGGGTPLRSTGGYAGFAAAFGTGGAPLWNPLWNQRFGDAAQQQAFSVTRDSSGNWITAGLVNGSVDFGGGRIDGAGGNDAFVVKYDPTGQYLWSRRFGDAADQQAVSVAVEFPSNVWVAGNFAGEVDFGTTHLMGLGEQDMFLARLDGNGNPLWATSLGDPSEQRATRVAVDASGNVWLTGAYQGSVGFGGGALPSAGGFDAFVASWTTAGQLRWARRFGDGADQQVLGLATDSLHGGAVITGSFAGSIDFGCGPMISVGGQNAFVAKLDAAGNCLWSRGYGGFQGEGNEFATAVAMDSAGNIWVAGHFEGPIELPLRDPANNPVGEFSIFLLKLDSAGNPLWDNIFGNFFGSFSNARAYDVAVDSAGNVALTGAIQASIDFGNGSLVAAGAEDAFFAEFSTSGQLIKAQLFGDAESQQGYGVAVDPNGNVALTGIAEGLIDFGQGPLFSSGGTNFYLALTSACSTAASVSAITTGSRTSPPTPKTSFSVNNTFDMFIAVDVVTNSIDQHTVTVTVYEPSGQVYEVFNDKTGGQVQYDMIPCGRRYWNDIELSGSIIQQIGLYGQWHADVSVDGVVVTSPQWTLTP